MAKIILATELPRQTLPVPLVEELTHPRGTKVILYGSPHFISPTDPNFNHICQTVDRLKPTNILVENAADFHCSVEEPERRNKLIGFDDISREQAILSGEPSLGLKLANDHGALAEWAAPLLSEQYGHLHSLGYSDLTIFTHYVFRAISMYHNYSDRFSLSEFIDWRIAQLNEQIPWRDSTLTWEAARDCGLSLWDTSLLEEPHKYAKRVNPNELPSEPYYTTINEVACKLNCFINKYLLERIIQLSTSTARLFVLFGASHIYQILPASKSYFSNGHK